MSEKLGGFNPEKRSVGLTKNERRSDLERRGRGDRREIQAGKLETETETDKRSSLERRSGLERREPGIERPSPVEILNVPSGAEEIFEKKQDFGKELSETELGLLFQFKDKLADLKKARKEEFDKKLDSKGSLTPEEINLIDLKFDLEERKLENEYQGLKERAQRHDIEVLEDYLKQVMVSGAAKKLVRLREISEKRAREEAAGGEIPGELTVSKRLNLKENLIQKIWRKIWGTK